MAVIMALRTINTENEITIFTDSTYVQKGISEWIAKWKINGWRTSNKKEVKNKDLWVQLDNLTSQLKINWIWVKGHSGHPENDRADYLANKGVGMEGLYIMRQIFLDTETTGLDPNQGHRIIEIAAIEMNNRQLTTKSLSHILKS